MVGIKLDLRPGDENERLLSLDAQRRVIGFLGLGLAAGVWLIAGLLPTPGLRPWDPLDSVSAYYYTAAGDVFVGTMFALFLVLVTYKGYSKTSLDHWLGIIGGLGAGLVALVPTAPPSNSLGIEPPAWWSPPWATVHLIGACVLLGTFVVFCFFLFPLTNSEAKARQTRKRVQSWFYLVCGVVMTVSMVTAIVMHQNDRPIFWPETIAIMAFAVAWLVKGEVDRIPGELAGQARRLRRKAAELVPRLESE